MKLLQEGERIRQLVVMQVRLDVGQTDDILHRERERE